MSFKMADRQQRFVENQPLLGEKKQEAFPIWAIVLIAVVVIAGASVGIVFAMQPTEETSSCTYAPYGSCSVEGIQESLPEGAACDIKRRPCTSPNPYVRKAATKDLNLLIPAYFYPTNNGVLRQEWLTLNESAHKYKDVEHVIVVNPSNGVDATSPPNSDWIQIVDMLSNLDNVKLIGYISTNYGDLTKEKPNREQIHGYFSNWKCQGIFFDETTGDVRMYERLIAYIHSRMHDTYNVFNFGSTKNATGVAYDNHWLTLASLNIMYENKKSEYDAHFVPSAPQLALPKNKSALVLRAASHIQDLRADHKKHFGYVYYTDQPNDYNTLYAPNLWTVFMDSINTFTPSPNSLAGSSCAANGDCLDNDCRTKCCVSTLNDANCGVCGSTGFCDTCKAGYTWQSGVGCTTQLSVGSLCSGNTFCQSNDCRTRCCSSTLNDTHCSQCGTSGECVACSTGYILQNGVCVAGLSAGAVCSSNSSCSSNDCRTKCCVSALNDDNCGVCGSTGYCETCKTGYMWQSGVGCVAKLSAGSNCSSDSVCSSNHCHTRCCSSTLNDTHCSQCGTSGECVACSTGYILQNGICVAKLANGAVCSSNSSCTSNDCRTKCCVSTLNDANCAVCGSTGFCETCKAGTTWQSGIGCA